MLNADTARSAIVYAEPGDVIDLAGVTIPDQGRTLIFRNLKDVTIKGGVSNAPWRFVRCSGVSVIGTKFVGPEPRERTALGFYESADVKALKVMARSWQSGVTMNDVERFEVSDCDFSDMKADGFQGASVREGMVARITYHGRRSDGDEHADAVQLRTDPDKPMTRDVLVDGLDAMGRIAGIRCTQAGGRMARITVKNLRARVSTLGGATFAGVDGLTLGNLDVGTLTGTDGQARIRIDKGCTDVKWVGPGVAAPYGTARAQAF